MYQEQKIKRSFFAICHRTNVRLLNFGKYLSNGWDIFKLNKQLFETKRFESTNKDNSYQIPAALAKHKDIS